MYIIWALMLLFVSLFATFRLAEMNHKKTFWGDLGGCAALAIGGFWKSMIFFHVFADNAWESPYHEVATTVLLVGVLLVTWSATCRGMRRRANDPERRAAAPVFLEDTRVE